MAYIAPSTTIQFMKNTGLSMSHENTLYFASESAKNDYWNTWFASNGQVGVVSQTYQRVNRNYCRIQSTMAVMYNVDYMRFINTSFENKWFYAFVTSINYINNNTVEVEYVLDPVMTWMGTFSLKQCFIERQHTVHDGIGNNIAEEGLPVGNYITENNRLLWGFSKDASVARVASALDTGATIDKCGIYAGMASTDCETQAILGTTINSLAGQDQADSIVSITMVPKEVQNVDTVIEHDITLAKPYDDIDGYVPRNKKLFCYPYKYLTIENSEGSTMDLMYEYMGTTPDATSSGNGTFRVVIGNYPTGCEIFLTPTDYKDNSGYEHRITITHMPQCAWSINSYEAYLAQKNAYYEQDLEKAYAATKRGIVTGGLSGLLGSGSSAGSNAAKSQSLGTGLATMGIGGATGAIGGAIRGVSSEWELIDNHMIENSIRPESPNTLHGSPSTDVLFSYGLKGFYAYEKCITKNYAMMLDSYFDMFGYYIKQLGTPNMNARPHWTYIKTIGCDVTGNVPASDKKAIEDIFDSGVRFWHNLDEMGNYSLDNSPS